MSTSHGTTTAKDCWREYATSHKLPLKAATQAGRPETSPNWGCLQVTLT